MEILRLPKNFIHSKENKRYLELSMCRIAITERNWVGDTYIEREDCDLIMKELREIDSIMNTNPNIKFKRSTYIMDTSVFSKESKNEKVIEFLEELEEFDLDDKQSISLENQMMVKKYEKKLRGYLNKEDCMPYLYRWAHFNLNHYFSKIIITLIEESLIERAKRVRNALAKDIKTNRSAIKRGDNRTYAPKATTKENEYTERLLKYAFDEPSLFYFAVKIISQYRHHVEKDEVIVKSESGQIDIGGAINSSGIVFYIRRVNKKMEIAKIMGNEGAEYILRTEELLPLKLSNNTLECKTIFDIPAGNEEYEHDKVNVLKVISKWVTERISNVTFDKIVGTDWIHFVSGEIFERAGLHSLQIAIEHMQLGGKSGEEVYVPCMCHVGNENVIFPLFSPNNWDELNARQAAILTYALCLLHDIVVVDNYELVEIDGMKHLNIKNREDEKKKHSSVSKKMVREDAEREENGRKRSRGVQQHWVSFHFRRLTGGRQAREHAKRNALKYGIKELPFGFTFVDSHIKGIDNGIDPNVKISAMEILKRTLKSLEDIKLDIVRESAQVNEAN